MAKMKEDKVKKERSCAVKRTSIGGQAVMEGVMMKGETVVATAVRTEAGEITVESKRVKSPKERNAFFRLPFVRGVVNLITQLFEGMRILMRSAEVYGDFAEPSKIEKQIAEKCKINPMNLVLAFSLFFGVGLAILLFVFTPNALADLICKIPAIAEHPLQSLWYSLIEGGIMLIVFVIYILFCTIMKDVRRVFMYHGAEHKVISCYEHGLELTVENAKTMSTQHSRCGTTFLFFVLMVSLATFTLINWGLGELGWLTGKTFVDALIKMASKLVFMPVVAGVSYEILKLLAKSDALPVRILRAPGMWLQKLTTKEPTDDMLEVSITAFNTVLAMEVDPSIPTTKFDIKMPTPIARKRIAERVKDIDESDIDWILVEATGKKRSEVQALDRLSNKEYESAMKIADKMADGTPLQYALGNTEFYGIRLAVNNNVLIPRPETELLAEKAINLAKENDYENCLDICTGSGAIAIAIALNTSLDVMASDISAPALEVAKANAISAGAKIEFVESDLFDKVCGKFDLITANPPYIPSADIDTLDKKVKDFEPRLALDGGVDGLDIYKRIADTLDNYLSDNGTMLLEFGIGQENDMREIFSGYNVEIIPDLEGIDRIAVVTRKN
ncbi:MAG: peptide chain release factor N(5)-glutamine methyltransferase [Clostridia bacterium]|nr:peptide chain release factor N(5)-glutamine methyltransferase [Clostridia bacterium]